MPPIDRDSRLKEAAVLALRANRVEDALKTAESLAETLPNDPEVFQILGLCYTRIEKWDEAGKALLNAVSLAPAEPKHHFNLAVHLRATGDEAGASTEVDEALRLLPTYPDALALRRELDGVEVTERKIVHLLAWLKGREVWWDRAAYVVMGLDVLLSLLLIFHFPAAPSGKSVKQGNLPDVALRIDPLSQFTVFLFVVSTAMTFLWMLADIVDRRKRFTWLVPASICGILGLNVVAIALYFFAGRKLGKDSANPT